MDSPYFLLVETWNGRNCKEVENALANRVKEEFDGTIWPKTIAELTDHLKGMISDFEMQYDDDIIMGTKYYEEGDCGKFLLFGIFKVTIHPIRKCIPRYHVQMPEWYMPYKYAGWKQFTEEQRKKAVMDELEKVSNFLEGNVNNANVIMTQFKEDYIGWKIEVIDYVPQRQASKGLEPLEGEDGKEVQHG
jgi:hypothetical protein